MECHSFAINSDSNWILFCHICALFLCSLMANCNYNGSRIQRFQGATIWAATKLGAWSARAVCSCLRTPCCCRAAQTQRCEGLASLTECNMRKYAPNMVTRCCMVAEHGNIVMTLEDFSKPGGLGGTISGHCTLAPNFQLRFWGSVLWWYLWKKHSEFWHQVSMCMFESLFLAGQLPRLSMGHGKCLTTAGAAHV